MRPRSVAWLILLTACFAMAQKPENKPEYIDCKRKPDLCQVEIGGQTLTFGMPKSQALALLARTSYDLKEDRLWSAENKPYSVWYLTVREGQPFAGSLRAGIRFKGEKLDGAMVSWSPSSSEQTDFAVNLVNILDRFSKERLTPCALSVAQKARPHPQQEEADATFDCGMRGVQIGHLQGQKIADSAFIYELFGNW
jgi:hypothetical protein